MKTYLFLLSLLDMAETCKLNFFFIFLSLLKQIWHMSVIHHNILDQKAIVCHSYRTYGLEG